MHRRSFVYGGFGMLAACGSPTDERRAVDTDERHRWRTVTSWPPNFPGFGESANRLAERIARLSGVRLEIDVFAAGERAPAAGGFEACAGVRGFRSSRS